MDILYGMWLFDRSYCGYATASHLIKKYGSAKAVYEIASLDELTNDTKVRSEAAFDIVTDKNLESYLCRAELIERANFSYLSIADSAYPKLLKEIHCPPPFLFYKGENLFGLTNASISIVGSRNCTEYGRSAAAQIACDLARNGIIIVSGLARGIDATAHEGALKGAKSSTIGVLGCGIDQIYPRENAELYGRILDSGGMIISEFLPGTRAEANNFPQRNNIISGISCGTLVVEAEEKSGSLITARCAMEQGREVYAIPGNINAKTSIGCNNLLKDGAKLVLAYEDILTDLFHVLSDPSASKAQAESKLPALFGEQEKIYSSIRNGFQTIDGISAETALSASEVASAITLLEIGGYIEQKNGKFWLII